MDRGAGETAQWHAVAGAAVVGAALLVLLPFAPHGLKRAAAGGAPPPAAGARPPPRTAPASRAACGDCTAPLPAPRVHEDHGEPPCPGPHVHQATWERGAADCRCLLATRLACL